MNTFEKILLGNSPQLQSVLRAAQMVAASDVAVLICGESGTGKELLAQAIHSGSRRCDAPLSVINCAALPESLVESELFGHRKGAFTGAVHDYSGRIGAADGGTLFLDEIGELPLSAQAKLLRFLEAGECQAVGETRPRRVDVRVIAATNRDLYAEVQAGRFREDLYYRLNVVPLELPALRERSGDVPLLLDHLSRQAAVRHGVEPVHFSRESLKMLQRYSWPGNVRELRNFSERMAILMAGCTIESTNIPAEFHARPTTVGAIYSLPDEGISLEAVEVGMIRQALDKSGGNRSRAARLLGLTRDTLLYRLKKYAIDL